MKYFTFFALLLVIFVVYTTAQGTDPVTEPQTGLERCRGRPREPSCRGERDPGRGGRGCMSSIMWYYSERSGRCRLLLYFGCDGNRNRFCTWRECDRRCNR